MRYRYIYKYKTGLTKVKTRLAIAITALSLGVGGVIGSVAIFGSAHAVTPTWDASGSYKLDFSVDPNSSSYDSSLYDLSLTQNGQSLTGTGQYPSPGPYAYAWTATGTITGNTISLTDVYTQGAVGTTMHMNGTIASDGTMSGTWDDNYGGGRTGLWKSVSGNATQLNYVVVTPSNTQGWSTADTQPGGAVNYVVDSTAPGDPHIGALQLTTDATNTAKAQYMHGADVGLSTVKSLSYSTKQNLGPVVAAASYQLPVFLNGNSGFTTLVYEPYWNGTVDTGGNWQTWDVDAGLFWSSRTVTCSGGTITGTPGGPATYTLAQIEATCPSAQVIGFGVNIGSFNPSYDVESDLVNFNGTIYNFEPYVVATDKSSCKNGGYQNVTDNNGNSFRNQGQCVSWTEHYVNGHGIPALSRPSH